MGGPVSPTLLDLEVIMAKFTKHTVVHRGFDSVAFSPGDEVPEWAADKVGAHVTDSAAENPVEPVKAVKKSEEPAEEVEAEQSAEPDFTKPAAPKRGRPRKQA